jgi:regulator of nucleoside diphosphate kinase
MIPILTNSDHHTIKALLEEAHRASVSKDLDLLMGELSKAQVVADDEIESDIIRLGSKVEVEDVAANKKMKFQITLPKDADFKQQKISVLSPIGIALIGFRKGMTIEWTLPGGKKTINILEVEN